jgi:hypothetical protein
MQAVGKGEVEFGNRGNGLIADFGGALALPAAGSPAVATAKSRSSLTPLPIICSPQAALRMRSMARRRVISVEKW